MANDKLKLVYEGTSFGVWLRAILVLGLITLLIVTPSRFFWPIGGTVVLLLIVIFSYFLFNSFKNGIVLLQFKGDIIYATFMFGKKVEYKISESKSCVKNNMNLLTIYGNVKGDMYKVHFKDNEVIYIPDLATNSKSNNVSSVIRISDNAKELVELIKTRVKLN